MNELLESAFVMAVLMASSAVCLFIRPYLSDRHRNPETMDVVKLISTMLVTFAALVLGLVTSSAKTDFDTVDNDVKAFSIRLIQLDRVLREYGADAEPIRHILRSYTAAAIASTWRDERRPAGDYYPILPETKVDDVQIESATLGDMLADVEREIRHLQPRDHSDGRLLSDALARFQAVMQVRWKLIEEARASINTPFFIVMVVWLAVVFASFGLCAPANGLTWVMIGLGAFSIASAIFVILELGTPFSGLVTVSSEPLRDALAHLSR